jgi:anthranilate phosphoribosyltransferase
MFELLKEVGRGKRGAKDLTYEQAMRAAELILTGQATPLQVGAFLMAERIKMESPDEILAFVEACRQRSYRHPIEGSLDCAGPYDGRTRSFVATLPAAFVLSACDVPVVLHGSPGLPPKWGITLIEIVSALGIPMDRLSKPAVKDGFNRTGFLFVPAEDWSAGLGSMRPFRKEMGVRTLFNTVEKLLRFTDAPYMAIGVFHGTVFEKVAELLIKLGVRRGIVVQGIEGSEDVSVEKKTRAFVVHNGIHEQIIIDPEELGVQTDMPEMEWTPELQAQTAKAVLQGDADPVFRNMVLLNSAVRLWITEKAPSIEEGLLLATHVLDEGVAWKQYQTWVEAVNNSHLTKNSLIT